MEDLDKNYKAILKKKLKDLEMSIKEKFLVQDMFTKMVEYI